MPEESRLRKINRSEFDCSSKAFWRAASQRLQAANLLLESEVFLDAVYLAGYVVECAMKALILKRTPAAERRGLCEELTSGARAHNLDVLSGYLRAKGCSIPVNIRKLLDILNDEWRTDLRYIGAVIPGREAEQFIERVRTVYAWVGRSL